MVFKNDQNLRQAAQSARGTYGKEGERKNLKQMSKLPVVQSHFDLHQKPFWEISNEQERAYFAVGASSIDDDEDLLRDLNRNQDQNQSNILLQLDQDDSLAYIQNNRREIHQQLARKLNLNDSADKDDLMLASVEGEDNHFLVELLRQRLQDEEDNDGLRGGFVPKVEIQINQDDLALQLDTKQRGANTLDCRMSKKKI